MKKFFLGLSMASILYSSISFAQNVGIGTTTPTEKLHVAGNILTDTLKAIKGLKILPEAGKGKVLTSDSSGNASWQTNSVSSNSGYGLWGDCATNSILSDYNPVLISDRAQGDYFGSSVALNVNQAIIGANSKTINGNANQGAAYIFNYNGVNWVQVAELTASDGASGDLFGSAVSIYGDYAFVGAQGNNTYQGKSYIFHFNGSAWVQTQILSEPGGVSYSEFGSGNIYGNYLAIGSQNNVGSNAHQGSIYIYQLTGSTWTLLQTLTASDGTAQDRLGSSVYINNNTIIAGAPLKTVGANIKQGMVYFFHFNGSIWVQQNALVAGDGAANDHFGASTYINGSYAIVGAPYKKIGANNIQGEAYIYFFDGTNWIQQFSIIDPTGAANDLLGATLAVNDRYALVGSYQKTIGTNAGQGAVFVYQNINGYWRLYQTITDPAGGANFNFGYSLDCKNKTFAIGQSGFNNNTGMIIFGKLVGL